MNVLRKIAVLGLLGGVVCFAAPSLPANSFESDPFALLASAGTQASDSLAAFLSRYWTAAESEPLPVFSSLPVVGTLLFLR